MRAYVLVNATPGRSLELAQGIRDVQGVQAADVITGEYDIVVTVNRSISTPSGKADRGRHPAAGRRPQDDNLPGRNLIWRATDGARREDAAAPEASPAASA